MTYIKRGVMPQNFEALTNIMALVRIFKKKMQDVHLPKISKLGMSIAGEIQLLYTHCHGLMIT